MADGGIARASRRFRLLSIAGGLSIAGVLGAAVLAVWLALPHAAASGAHLANADDVAAVVHGKELYKRYCASCHGHTLRGQPLWQLLDAFAGRRAPAHDETGHTWQHPDEDLFHMTKYGRFESSPPDRVSSMPAFKNVLGDQDILAVIAFIKARWPLGLRVSQAMLNPGYAGMPPGADQVEWQLPPTCIMSIWRPRIDAVPKQAQTKP
ncbi:MAG TPA: c-type cytochrome [Stellaceae bacterium]|nr:c-type cytochrome [Stellaceae bacterium]